MLRNRCFLDVPRRILLCGASVACLVALAGEANAVARFGTWCQEEYQNGWQDTDDYGWELCNSFNNELDDTDTKVFYYNLHGAKSHLEESGDSGDTDAVNLMYINTHGGVSSTASRYAMWDDGVRAYTTSMRLGDDSYGLSIFASYACHTAYRDDGNFWTRWYPAFAGGLKYLVGSHDTINNGWTLYENGEDFADELQSSAVIKYAWRDGCYDTWTDQDLAAGTFGTNESDCWNRLNNMKWQNYASGFARIRDSQITHWCHTQWTDY